MESPQTETTPFNPRSPYAVAKVFAHHITVDYRDAYGMHATNGILFNHESPRRGATFLTRKVTRGVAAIVAGSAQTLYLGNLDARRDWGYAPEYVEAMWRMLQQDEPGDYVIATGEMHTVREFVERAFALVGLDWERYVEIDPRYFRPTEVDELCGDASKAERELGWRPTTTFEGLVRLMLSADLWEAGLDPAEHLVAAPDAVVAEPMRGALAGRRVMVTGGAGFLGRAVCARLGAEDVADIFVPRSAQLRPAHGGGGRGRPRGRQA